MKKTLWFTIPLLIILWYFIAKYINGLGDSDFQFSRRDQETVFPTPTQTVFEVNPTQKVTLSITPVATSASESNVLRY